MQPLVIGSSCTVSRLIKLFSSHIVASWLEACTDPSARSQPQRSAKINDFIGNASFTYLRGGQLPPAIPYVGKDGMTGEVALKTGYVTWHGII